MSNNNNNNNSNKNKQTNKNKFGDFAILQKRNSDVALMLQIFVLVALPEIPLVKFTSLWPKEKCSLA